MSVSGKILAIDYGRARVGLAICDQLGISIKPLGHVNREDDLQAASVIAKLALQEKASCIIIGLPLHANGDEGENVVWVRTFSKILKEQTSLAVLEVDERHSSQEAESLLRQEGDWPCQTGVLDARAACIILQRYLLGER